MTDPIVAFRQYLRNADLWLGRRKETADGVPGIKPQRQVYGCFCGR